MEFYQLTVLFVGCLLSFEPASSQVSEYPPPQLPLIRSPQKNTQYGQDLRYPSTYGSGPVFISRQTPKNPNRRQEGRPTPKFSQRREHDPSTGYGILQIQTPQPVSEYRRGNPVYPSYQGNQQQSSFYRSPDLSGLRDSNPSYARPQPVYRPRGNSSMYEYPNSYTRQPQPNAYPDHPVAILKQPNIYETQRLNNRETIPQQQHSSTVPEAATSPQSNGYDFQYNWKGTTSGIAQVTPKQATEGNRRSSQQPRKQSTGGLPNNPFNVNPAYINDELLP